MFFKHSLEENITQPDESQRRRDTDSVLNQASEILEMSEVQDALERLNLGRVPNLLQRLYVPCVDHGQIDADKNNSFIPIVSIYPHETLSIQHRPISLNSGGSDALGVTIGQPQTLVGLAQSNANNPTAPITLVHELTHAHQLIYDTVDQAAYKRFPRFGGPKEAESLNAEAVIADVLIKSNNRRWKGNYRILTTFTSQIRSKPPVFPIPKR